ncbi:SWI/SNF complex subunit SWI3D isoform X2 [Rutidosis leptorrhynchoides]|uniref:SWI/SNF complex subunit SWI3D isoform X2 n=1 Tax=Rutidosis leptorrhynchoides TaxID=125765 RepID=UPI003A99D0B9
MEEKHNSPTTVTESPPPPLTAELPSSRRRGGALKRKASNFGNNSLSTPPPSSKRQTREKPSPVLFPPIHNGPLTRGRLQPNYIDSTSFWDAVAVNGETDVGAVAKIEAKVEEELVARRAAWEALEAKIEAEFEKLKSRDVNSHVVPTFCGWFSWTKVHQLEEKALPSFFNGKLENRTPEIYMEIRNSIMRKFHANPNTQIEEKDLSEISVGDLDAKKEVMEFLDYWGLINYYPLPEAGVATSVGGPEEAAKHNSLIQKLYEFEVEQVCSPATPRSSFATPAVPSRLAESMLTDESLQPEGPSVEYHCNSCAADCSRKRYHCQKQADYDLCTECFNDGKFDSDMAPSDFILMDAGDAAGTSSGKWTDQETLLLLEALELFKENWNEIAEHVATKTKAQCILHFVQMPIEDTFRDCDDEDDANHKERTNKKDTNDEEKTEKKDTDEEKKTETKDTDGKEETEMKDTNLDDNDEKKEVRSSLEEEEEADKKEVDEENGDSKGVKETEDTKVVLNNDDLRSDNGKPDASPMDTSEQVDNDKLKDINQENGVNIAVKALREAFDAVGSLSPLNEKLSFADAGNPVMAMAAFLTRLVEPNIVTASARTSLKSVSGGATGLQLSARHCFVLEDPTNEKKKADDKERDDQEVVEQEGLKEQSDPVNEHNEKEDTNVAGNEKEKLVVSSEKEEDPITPVVVVSKKGKNAGSRRKCSTKKDKVTVTEKQVITEETDKQTQVENPVNIKKESEDSADAVPPSVAVSQSTDAPKDVEMAEKAEPPQSAPAEKTDNSGEIEAIDTDNVKKQPVDTKDDPIMHNLTRAAVTAISAAAVKAKLLADQEEDHIRQLATSLVEKQLHKLETKLAFFTEMEGVVSRAREQLERSKQRLYHERAQIITARLGMSASSAGRPMGQQPLPNRPGATLPNTVQRPPNPMMSMTPQRPPLSRPMMGPTPPVSNLKGPGTVAGNSDQVSNNQGMK